MTAPDFEEQYQDVLQNIEFALVQVYRRYEQMTDYEAEKAVNTLIRTYQAEARNRKYRQPRMNERTEEAYGYIKGMCDWRMGREDLYNEDDNPIELPMTPLQVDEVIDCLKRVKRSIRKWNKQGGRRGYFYFVDQFFPDPDEE